MAVQEVLWLGSNIMTDENHRLVTDEQIAKWNASGSTEVITGLTDWDTATNPGIYLDTKTATNKPIDGNTYFIEVKANAKENHTMIFQEGYSIGNNFIKYARKGTLSNGTWTFTPWYRFAMQECPNVALILQDFEYVIDSDTGNYILTEWKGTLNGEPSNDLVVPDTDAIQIEI